MLHLGTVNPDAHRRLGQHATVHTRNSVLRPLIRATQQGTATSRKIEVSEKIARRTPILRATGWYRLASVPPRGVPAVGQWTRSTRYNAKQFRLCRIGIPGRGKVCTAYSGIIVAL